MCKLSNTSCNVFIRPIFFLSLVLLCVGCMSKTDTITEGTKDSADENREIDASPLSGTHDHTIKLQEWKNSHHDEWLVVKQSLDIMEGNCYVDYKKIDKLVRTYISKKHIGLSADKREQIKIIKDICESKFDIRGYDETNAGMHIAENIALMYEKYINWLLANEVEKIEGTGICMQEEDSLLNNVMATYYNCCDSIGNAFEGTMGWVFKTSVDRIKIDFKRSMYMAMLTPQSPSNMPLLLTSKHFKEECERQIRSFGADSSCTLSYDRKQDLLDDYLNAITDWIEYRDKVDKNISDKKLRKNYTYLTRSFAWEQYGHLKAAFNDICGE